MLRYMERSTIYYLKQKGWTNVQIAEFTGHHRDTIARVLREDVDTQPKTRNRTSAVAVFDAQIAEWLDKNLLVSRMLELARADVEHPYTGGETAFYDYLRKVRRARKQTPRDLALRFEGVPGEFLQIDWGEVRDMAFTKPELEGQTRYFFAARLKYSRYHVCEFSRRYAGRNALTVPDCLFYHNWWCAVGGGDGQYENGGVGSKRAARAGLESGLPEARRGVQISSRGVRSCFWEPERSGREPGQIRQGELHRGTHLS